MLKIMIEQVYDIFHFVSHFQHVHGGFKQFIYKKAFPVLSKDWNI